MSDTLELPHRPATGSTERLAEPRGADTAAEYLKHGPRGAFVVSGIAVALLFIGWLAFYFLLFMPRGSIG
jgi:hypothetical protein